MDLKSLIKYRRKEEIVRFLHSKFIKDINDFYGDYQAGEEVGSRAPLVDYTIEDLEPGEVFDRRDNNA